MDLKPIKISTEKETYILEFDRMTCRQLESRGLVITELYDKPNTMIPLLFSGAFLKNHRKMAGNREEIDAIWEHLPKKVELLARLVELFSACTDTLFDEPEEGAGNVDWAAE